jgi:hypothetical protein
MKLGKLLTSKYLYYMVLVFMSINILGYVSAGSMECLLLFAITYYVSNRFTKNRTVDIVVGLFVSNFLFGCGRVREGLEGLEDKAGKLASECDNKAKKECKSPTCKWDQKKKKCLQAAANNAAAAAKELKKASQADKKAASDLGGSKSPPKKGSDNDDDDGNDSDSDSNGIVSSDW